MNREDGIYRYEPLWGEWKVKELIGSGSFGKAYKISKTLGDEEVISVAKYIKIPNEAQYEEAKLTVDNRSTMREYFKDITTKVENEIKLLYKLRGNSNIVSYEDYTIKERADIGWDILIKMEYVKPLDKYIQENNLTKKDVIQLGIDICSGLQLCHDNGIIHRDIKDSNIFVSDNGSFKIGDFGIATNLSSNGTAMSRVGTPYYMAPEIIFNDNSKSYNKNIDIYSLGIVLYRFLNKLRFPFMPEYPQPVTYTNKEESQTKRLNGEEMPKPVVCDEKLWKVIKKACEYDPKKRYLNVEDFKNDLIHVLNQMSKEEKNQILIKSRGSIDVDNDTKVLTDDKTVVIIDETTIIEPNHKNNTHNKLDKKVLVTGVAICITLLTGGAVLGLSKNNILTLQQQKPITPKVDKIDYTSNLITGIGEAEDEIFILKDGEEIASGVASSDGTFKINIEKQEPGTQIEVYSKNKKGHMSEKVIMMVVKENKTLVNDLFEGDTTITGTGEADNRISIIKDGLEISSAVIDNNGNYIVNIESQSAGTKLFVVSKYKDGKISEKIQIDVKERKSVEIDTKDQLIKEIESIISEVESYRLIKYDNGKDRYKIDEDKLEELKSVLEKIKSGEQVNVEEIPLDIGIKELEYGAQS